MDRQRNSWKRRLSLCVIAFVMDYILSLFVLCTPGLPQQVQNYRFSGQDWLGFDIVMIT